MDSKRNQLERATLADPEDQRLISRFNKLYEQSNPRYRRGPERKPMPQSDGRLPLQYHWSRGLL